MLTRTGLTLAMLLLTVPAPAPATARAAAEPVVSAGGRHTCMLDGTGKAWCWGDNEFGQLGDGTQQDRSTPAPVAAPAGVSFTRLSTGARHTCGLGTDGTAYCWGDGTNAQVGNLQSGWFVDPVRVQAPPGVTFEQITAGDRHTCGIGSDDRTYCWGDGEHGQRGDGSTEIHGSVVTVETPPGVTLTRITTGDRHTCGTGRDTKTYCWGGGVLKPAAVQTPPGVSLTSLTAGGSHTCGIGSDAGTYCWSDGPPALVPGGVRFTRIDAGGDQTCGIGSDAKAYCWSDGPPVLVPGGLTLVQVDAGDRHTCAVARDGEIYCWGAADQTRPAVVNTSALPAGPTPPGPTVDLEAGLFHTCVRDDRGRAYCWGRNEEGALGIGSTTARARPVAVNAPAGVTFRQLALGGYHTCGIGSDQRTYCWGGDEHGQLGDGGTTNRTRPTLVDTPAGVRFTRLAAGKDHTCGIGSDTRTYCWGADFYDKLGDGADPEQPGPSVVKAPAGVTFTQLTAGTYHTCGIGDDTKTYCWGYGDSVGDGTTDHRPEPVAVRAPAGVAFTRIDAGAYHTCGLGDDSRIYCWGDNNYSQIGDGTDKDRSRPVPVLAPPKTRFVQVTAGDAHTCALSDTRRAYCWGQGFEGRLGDGTNEDRSRPATVLAPGPVAFTRLEAGGYHTCGLGDDGETYCWGSGDDGTLGNSDFVPQARPVPVSAPAGAVPAGAAPAGGAPARVVPPA